MKKKGRASEQMREHIKKNIAVYTFVAVLMLIGVVFGAIVVNSLHIAQKQNLIYYVEKFFQQLKVEELSSKGVFLDAFLDHGKYVFLIWLLGISMIGLPIIFIIVFLKGVVIGFTVGFFVNQLGTKGFYLAVISILPQNLFIVPLLLILSSVAISFSLKLMKQLFVKHHYQKIRTELLHYTLIFITITLLTIIPTMIEVYVSPLLIESVLNLTGK